MKTLKEFLVGRGLYSKFVFNVINERLVELGRTYEEAVAHLDGALEKNELRAFNWVLSPEGYDFWNKQHTDYLKISGWME